MLFPIDAEKAYSLTTARKYRPAWPVKYHIFIKCGREAAPSAVALLQVNESADGARLALSPHSLSINPLFIE
ncbi:hypothetical protein EVAR_40381_1 [Eumeta japonica]|uniref:Uncharacterized protein n=1 Tax=Eumeta variegata TaxID=151549 RepID=A0A4C1XJ38_EUMVA|nr:hypothetical protein EVAR_40381_1 [Eumeta japonica]